MSTDSSHPETDDNFQLIRGIGAGIERRLHKANIHTYAQLASKTPQEMAEILKGLPGYTQESNVIKEWISRAGELAKEVMPETAGRENARPFSEEMASGENLARNENFTVVLRIGEDNRVIRTRVMHMQDASERAWPGWDGQKLLDFIAAHAGLEEQPSVPPHPHPHEEEKEAYPQAAGIPASGVGREEMAGSAALSRPGEARSTAAWKGEVAITKMEVRSVDQPNSSRILRKGEAFYVCLGLNMGQVDEPAGTVFNYSAAVFAQELNTRVRQKIAAGQGKLTLADQADIQIQGNPLPAGVYRLEAVVMLTEEGNPTPQSRRTAFLDGGLFQVS